MVGFEKDRSGGRALLFDKLTDHQPGVDEETPVVLNYTRQGLFASIKKEISDLLNCRCKLSWPEYKSVKDVPYGVPDLYGMLAASSEDKEGALGARNVCRYVEKAVALFEPRLQNVAASSKKIHGTFGYTVEVAGDVVVDGKLERIFFPVDIDTRVSENAQKEDSLYNAREPALKWPQDRNDRDVDKA